MHPFRWLTIAIFALLLAACSPGAPKDAEVVIPQGASIAKAGEILEDAGLVPASSFRNQARFFGSDEPIKPGEYKIEKGMDAGDILALFQSGKTIQRLVMIPEGMPSIMVWERLMAEPRLKGEIPVPAEGSILPDSYAFTTGDFHEPIRIKERNRRVTEKACRKCHEAMVQSIEGPEGPHRADQQINCLRCHSDVGHPTR